jgi:hypothetical protein
MLLITCDTDNFLGLEISNWLQFWVTFFFIIHLNLI